jgi:hypothetical protein
LQCQKTPQQQSPYNFAHSPSYPPSSHPHHLQASPSPLSTLQHWSTWTKCLPIYPSNPPKAKCGHQSTPGVSQCLVQHFLEAGKSLLVLVAGDNFGHILIRNVGVFLDDDPLAYYARRSPGFSIPVEFFLEAFCRPSRARISARHPLAPPPPSGVCILFLEFVSHLLQCGSFEDHGKTRLLLMFGKCKPHEHSKTPFQAIML